MKRAEGKYQHWLLLKLYLRWRSAACTNSNKRMIVLRILSRQSKNSTSSFFLRWVKHVTEMRYLGAGSTHRMFLVEEMITRLRAKRLVTILREWSGYIKQNRYIANMLKCQLKNIHLLLLRKTFGNWSVITARWGPWLLFFCSISRLRWSDTYVYVSDSLKFLLN